MPDSMFGRKKFWELSETNPPVSAGGFFRSYGVFGLTVAAIWCKVKEKNEKRRAVV